MKAVNTIIIPLVAAGLMVELTLTLSGCSKQSPFEPVEYKDAGSQITLNKLENSFTVTAYSLFAERTFKFHQNKRIYLGSTIELNDGTTFGLAEGALTPPAGTPLGADVTLSMLVKKQQGGKRIRFTFSPPGCKFDPPALVEMDWYVSQSPNLKLYYIDKNGNYIEQPREDIEMTGNHIKLYIHHFSQYELADDE